MQGEEQPTPELRGLFFANDGGSIGCDFLAGDEEVFVRFDHSLDTDTEGRMYYDGKLVEFYSEDEVKLFEIFDRFLDATFTDEEIAGLEDGTLGTQYFDTQAKKEAVMFYGTYRGYIQLKANATKSPD